MDHVEPAEKAVKLCCPRMMHSIGRGFVGEVNAKKAPVEGIRPGLALPKG
jgi:hypothetical protein